MSTPTSSQPASGVSPPPPLGGLAPPTATQGGSSGTHTPIGGVSPLQHTKSQGVMGSHSQLLSTTRTLMSQMAQNLHLLKLRSLHVAKVPLSKDEQLVFLKEDGSDVMNRPGIAEELKMVEESVGNPDPEKSMELLKDQVDSLFRFMFEEYSLRLRADQDLKYEETMPERRLLSAVEFQRDTLDKHRGHTKKQATKIEDLESRNKELQIVLQRHDEVHKLQLTGYLKELCVLKEQLYRSYRDKDYVGKPIDMLECVLDEDTAEDVSVDELLNTRRLYRGVERQLNQLRQKIKEQEQDLNSKTTFIQRMQEKARTQELTVATLKSDIEQLNGIVLGLEAKESDFLSQIAAAREEAVQANAQLSAAKRKIEMLQEAGVNLDSEGEDFSDEDSEDRENNNHNRAVASDRGSAGSREGDKLTTTHAGSPSQRSGSRASSRGRKRRGAGGKRVQTTESSTQASLSDLMGASQSSANGGGGDGAEGESALLGDLNLAESLADMAENKQLYEQAKVKNANLEKKIQENIVQINDLSDELEALKKKYATLEKEYLDDRSRMRILEADNEELKSRCEIAELEADNAMHAAAEQSEILTKEIENAARTVTALRKRNKALMEGYLSMDQRLTALKSRAGIDDYKKRANEFHLRRSEQNIDLARQDAEKVKAECRAQVVAAELKQEHAEHMLAMANEDLRSQEVVQAQTIENLTQRTAKVQTAFEALLVDFENLKGEYMNQTTGMAEDQATAALKRLVKKAGDGAGAGGMGKNLAPGEDGRPATSSSGNVTPMAKDTLGTKVTPKPDNFNMRQRFLFELLEEQGMDPPTQVVATCAHYANQRDTAAKNGSVPVIKQLSVHGNDFSAQDRMVLVSHELNALFSSHFTSLFNTFTRLLNLDKDLKAREDGGKATNLASAFSTTSGGGGASKPGSSQGGQRPGSRGSMGSSQSHARPSGIAKAGLSKKQQQKQVMEDSMSSATGGADAIKKALEENTDKEFRSMGIPEQKIQLAWEKMKTFTNLEKILRHLLIDVRGLISASEVANLVDDTQVGLPGKEDDLPIQTNVPEAKPSGRASKSGSVSDASLTLLTPDQDGVNLTPGDGSRRPSRRPSLLPATTGPRASTPAGQLSATGGGKSVMDEGGSTSITPRGPLPPLAQPSKNPALAAATGGGPDQDEVPAARKDSHITTTTSLQSQPNYSGEPVFGDDRGATQLQDERRPPADTDDANLGDFSSVNTHLRAMEERFAAAAGDGRRRSSISSSQTPSGKNSGGLDDAPWKQHKASVKKQQAETPPPAFHHSSSSLATSPVPQRATAGGGNGGLIVPPRRKHI